jgi:hypothetical protein
MVNYLPHWPHDHQDVVDRMTGEHWFVSKYHRLRRTPTRAELFHRYIPADILEDRPNDMSPRLREALEYLIQEAENEAIELANNEGVRSDAGTENGSTDMEIDPEDEEMSVIVLSDNEYEEERYLHPQGLQDDAFDEVYHIIRERSPEVAEDAK